MFDSVPLGIKYNKKKRKKKHLRLYKYKKNFKKITTYLSLISNKLWISFSETCGKKYVNEPGTKLS